MGRQSRPRAGAKRRRWSVLRVISWREDVYVGTYPSRRRAVAAIDGLSRWERGQQA